MKKISLQPFSQLKNASLLNSHAHCMVFDSNQTCYLVEGGPGGNTTFESVIYSINNDGEIQVFAVLPHKITTNSCELFILKDILFVGANSRSGNLILAYSLNGNLLWSICCEYAIHSITNASDDLIISFYANADNARIESISLEGTTNWQISVGSVWTAPIVNNGRIFIGVNDGIGVYDFSGKLIKLVDVERGIFPFKTPIISDSSTLIHIPVSNNTSIYSINATGDVKQNTKFPYTGLGFIWNNFSDEKIYAISRFNRFYKIDVSKNEIESMMTLPGNTISPPVYINDDTIVVGYDNNKYKGEICVVDNKLQEKALYKISGELVDIAFDSLEYVYALAYTTAGEINIYRIKVV